MPNNKMLRSITLRHFGLRRFTRLPCRFNSTAAGHKVTIEDPDIIYQNSKPISEDATQLKFAYRSTGEVFGQLVEEVHHDRDPLHNSRVITPEEALEGVDPRYRDPQTGELLEAATSKDARLDHETLWGRVNQKQVIIPDALSEVIQNNFLFQYEPKALKEHVVEWYTSINESGLREASESELSADVSIAASFAQDYAVSYQVLDEFIKRLGSIKANQINNVLDVGVGPSISMLALNEIMGDEWNPERKDSVIYGDFHMARRAKTMLSRQINENFPRKRNVPHQQQLNIDKRSDNKLSKAGNGSAELDELAHKEEEIYIGKVKTKSLEVKTVLLDRLRPADIKYDLIIVSYKLLESLENFPFEVDAKLEEYVRRLNPGGHLVLIERGTPLGSEIIARARQVMLRPEKYPDETEKHPRPFRSSAKKLSAREQLRLSRLTPEEKALAIKDLEPELLENFEVIEDETSALKLDNIDEPIDMSVIAPCPHHGKCPLQFFDPQVYLYGQIGKKLKFCSYNVSVHRPTYLLELKRGRKLATKWTASNSGVGISSLAKAGRGRENGNDYETASYSYLIAERSPVPASRLEEERVKRSDNGIQKREVGYRAQNRGEYPRILAPPMKKKGYVIMDLCAPSGHVEKWHISKSVGKQDYHDARKANMGDLWPLGYKSANQSKKENTFYFERIVQKRENLRKKKKRDATKLKRKISKDYKEALESDNEGIEKDIVRMAKIDAYEFLAKPKETEKLKDKRKYKY